MGSLSIWPWLIVLLVVVLVFGTKKLRNMGTDLGSAVKGFKDGMKADESVPPKPGELTSSAPSGSTIEGEVKDKQRS